MTALAAAPLVRTEDGTILGPDYRRIPALAQPGTQVPGVIPASAVQPGDTLQLDGEQVVVISKREHGSPDTVYVGTRTPGGAEIVHEYRSTERVHVTAVGAFDR